MSEERAVEAAREIVANHNDYEPTIVLIARAYLALSGAVDGLARVDQWEAAEDGKHAARSAAPVPSQ